MESKRENKHLKMYRIKRRFIITLCAILVIAIYLFKNSSFLLRATTMIAFIVVFYMVDHFFDIRLKTLHYAFVIIIAISGLILSPLYYIYPNYDKIQHLIIPVMVYIIILHSLKKQTLKQKWKLVFAFFITVAILGLFEVGEYALDYLFDLKLQGVYIRDIQGLEKLNLVVERIDDTMIDLSLGILGTSIYSLFRWLTLKRKNEEKMV